MLHVHLYISQDHLIGLTPAYQFILNFLLEHKIAGATLFKGIGGFGKHQKMRYPNAIFSFDDTPMLISFLDEEEKVKQVLIQLREQYAEGLIVSNRVEKW